MLDERPHDLPVALEITPPRKPSEAIVRRRAGALGERGNPINVISRPDRWSSLDASICLRRGGFEAVWHLANRGRTHADLERDVDRARAAGLRRVLCIRGEHKSEDAIDTPKIRDVVRLLVSRLPNARVSVTLNHHVANPRVLTNLLAKIDAGAQAVQTQLAFDLDPLAVVAAQIKADRPTVEITPMLMPVLTLAAADRIERRLSIAFPARQRRALARYGEAAGWAHFKSLVEQIRRDPLFDGVALMTPMDVSAPWAARVTRALR